MSKPIPITPVQRFFQTLPRCTGNCNQGRKECDCWTGVPEPQGDRPAMQFFGNVRKTSHDNWAVLALLSVAMVAGCAALVWWVTR